MKVTGKDAELVLRLMRHWKEHDDVQNVYRLALTKGTRRIQGS